MSNEEWSQYKANSRLRHMAKYWGIFDDVLVGNPITPSINLVVKYGDQLIHRGHVLTPTLVRNVPQVSFGCGSKNSFYTLLMVDADEPNEKAQRLEEQVHWMVTDIPGKDKKTDISLGKTVLEYIPPHPSQGSSLHRYVFVLFEQKEPSLTISKPVTKTNRFQITKKFMEQNKLQPVGFCFFRAEWDPSVSETYKNILGVQEPVWVDPEVEKKSTKSSRQKEKDRSRGRMRR